MIKCKKVTLAFHPESGERIAFSISNNGHKRWEKSSAATRTDAIGMLDNCIAYIERMKSEIGSYGPLQYNCPNCQGCGCTTCGGYGHLVY